MCTFKFYRGFDIFGFCDRLNARGQALGEHPALRWKPEGPFCFDNPPTRIATTQRL